MIAFSMVTALVLSAVTVPLVIRIDKRLKVGQPVLSYVDNHKSKSGTPTFGGVAFLLATIVSVLIFARNSKSLALMCVAVSFAYGVIGFTDDFIKTRSKQNKGLSAIQKIVFQALVSIIIASYAYSEANVQDKLILPFSLNEINLGYFAIPYYIIVFLAFTNAVNLVDGLDGLAGKTSVAYLIFFGILIWLNAYFRQGLEPESENLVLFAFTLALAVCGFLVYNSFPAKIFMGDTGSLALGGGIGALAVMSKLSLYAPIIGIMFVVTCVSDIIQVLYFKKTGKRVFIMAPLHHHFERKGVHENKIVSAYTFITVCAGLLCVAITFAINGH
ncbi:MAG: phospho-N-acetylmuramoyl-pentapeptide-transferase [Clostridiales bacterium]|nr:phospho-N-acetylmuramoyl-pentapeptide-transferase [Clostridiales bacterium]